MLERAKSHHCQVKTFGILACILACFVKVLEGNFLASLLQNLNGVTDFSQEKF